MTIVTIGLDLAKSVFPAHGVDERGATTLTKRLHRKQMASFFSKLSRRLIAMEACGTAHYWLARSPRWGTRSASFRPPT
jgi:transposase